MTESHSWPGGRLTRSVLDTMSGRPPCPALPDRVPIRSGIAYAGQHHHLPLLVFP
jgi:5-hydroxyisourate hydrolase-like protein (transthyretin family)